MTPFIIFSTPRSGSTLLMRMLDSTPDVRCAGECDGLLWQLYGLDQLRRKTRKDSPEAFLPLDKQLAKGHFPSHYNPSVDGNWKVMLYMMFHTWVGAGSNPNFGLKEVHVGKAGFQFAKPLWDWLIEIMPKIRFIFLTRDSRDVAASMERNPDWWVPSYTHHVGSMRQAVEAHEECLLEAAEHYADRSTLLTYADLQDFDRLSYKLPFPLSKEAWAEQLAIKL